MNSHVNAIRRLDLPSPAKFVLWVLADMANDKGEAFPSLDVLMQETSMARATVCRAIKQLVDAGLIQIGKRQWGHKSYVHNVYKLAVSHDNKLSSGDELSSGERQTESHRETNRVSEVNCNHQGTTKEPPEGEKASPPPAAEPPLAASRSMKSKSKPTLELPSDFPDDLRAALTRWLDYKRERGQGYKPRGWDGLTSKCRKHSSEAVIAAIDQAISNNWSGFFPDKAALPPKVPVLSSPSTQPDSGPPGWRETAQRMGVPDLEDFQVWEHVPRPRRDRISQALGAGDLFAKQP